jgi:glutaredoxin 3
VADVRIYTAPFCGYCTLLKRLMRAKGVAFEEFDVARDSEQRRWLASVTGRRTVPQLFIDGRPHGGYTDAVALDRAGELDRLLGLA